MLHAFENRLINRLLSEKSILGWNLDAFEFWSFWVAVFWKNRHLRMPVGYTAGSVKEWQLASWSLSEAAVQCVHVTYIVYGNRIGRKTAACGIVDQTSFVVSCCWLAAETQVQTLLPYTHPALRFKATLWQDTTFNRNFCLAIKRGGADFLFSPIVQRYSMSAGIKSKRCIVVIYIQVFYTSVLFGGLSVLTQKSD